MREMPLTLWVIVAATVLFLYVRRAHLGIDRHPAEKWHPPLAKPTVRVPVLSPGLPGSPDWSGQ